MRLVLDIETSYQRLEGNKTDPSPYHPNNVMVSVGTIDIDTGEEKYVYFNHSDSIDSLGTREEFIKYVESAELIVGHNLKFDISWLLECGFNLTAKYYDTMITEYVLAKGQKPGLGLKACALRYGLTPKLDVFDKYFALKVNTPDIPKEELTEYGLGDIRTTLELYNLQQERLNGTDSALLPVVLTSCEVLPILIDMERNGIAIDTGALELVRKEYQEELHALETKLNALILEVMGHRRINLSSPEHLNWVIYSRRVLDKEKWAATFEIGSEVRGAVSKRKYPRRLDKAEFRETVIRQMQTLHRQEANQCKECTGRGKIRKTTVKGVPFARENKCPACEGAGFIYTDLPDIAGFMIQPQGSFDATVSGFSTDKDTIINLLKLTSTSTKAKEFLKTLSRFNAVQTYLDTFVEGISKNTRATGLLHTTFNQCVTATGRLSSSNPNFQNLPRGKTFPVRRTLKSRYKDGFILEADFAQLEFRTAAILSECPVALRDILANEDIHSYTSSVLTKAGQATDRQEAKSHTFKPLYGGMSGTPAEVTYYKAFLEKYTGIKAWQEKLLNTAVATKEVVIPSGRVYAFPNARRLGPDRVSGKTQIVNYPVQGFATADIVWCVIKEIYLNLKGMKSKLVLQVHDSIVCDVHPEEKDSVLRIFTDAFNNADVLIERQFKLNTKVPIGYEMKIGNNLLEMQKVA